MISEWSDPEVPVCGLLMTSFVTTHRSFVPRHNSTTGAEIDAMVAATGFKSIDALIDATVPSTIRRQDGMKMGKYTSGMCESEFLAYFK